jgi:hypothetical protein
VPVNTHYETGGIFLMDHITQGLKTIASVDAMIAQLSPSAVLDLLAHGKQSETYANLVQDGAGDRFWGDAVLDRMARKLQACIVTQS